MSDSDKMIFLQETLALSNVHAMAKTNIPFEKYLVDVDGQITDYTSLFNEDICYKLLLKKNPHIVTQSHIRNAYYILDIIIRCKAAKIRVSRTCLFVSLHEDGLCGNAGLKMLDRCLLADMHISILCQENKGYEQFISIVQEEGLFSSFKELWGNREKYPRVQ